MSDRVNVEAPEGQAAGRDVRNEAAPVVSIGAISGGTAVVGNQGDVHIQVATQSRSRPRIVVQPGPQHITPEQQLELRALVGEWLALHATLKKNPLHFGGAWTQVNKAAGATSYHLILSERYPLAVAFVKQQMAKLRNMQSAPSKDMAWRGKKIGAIKARCANQLGDINAYKPYIKKNFGTNSLTELATDELQRTYAYFMKKKGAS